MGGGDPAEGPPEVAIRGPPDCGVIVVYVFSGGNSGSVREALVVVGEALFGSGGRGDYEYG